MLDLTKDKNSLEKYIFETFREEDYDGGVLSLNLSDHQLDKDWIVAQMSVWDSFGSETIYAYINKKSGEVDGDLVDTFNESLEQKIKKNILINQEKKNF